MKNVLFDELAARVRAGGAILRGDKKSRRAFEADGPDVKLIRASYELAQNEFAAFFQKLEQKL